MATHDERRDELVAYLRNLTDANAFLERYALLYALELLEVHELENLVLAADITAARLPQEQPGRLIALEVERRRPSRLS